ncbi:MAG: carboxypeptidase-like regulatory domain-containing protein [Terracidiphilus sp.]
MQQPVHARPLMVPFLPLPLPDSVFRHSLQVALVLFLMLLPCRAQQSAQTWTGTVQNANGAPVAGARIQLAAEGAPTEPVQATSGADGSFRVGPVRPGQYRLSLQLSRSTGEAAQLVLAPLKVVSVSFVVQAGGESLTVMLGVGRAGAQTANSGGEELSSHEVSSLPLNKRDFSQLLLLAAGTMTDANGATNFTQQFAVNGQRGVEATFAMDGADTTDPEMGGATFTNFDVDAVEEIQSSSGWMPAEIGFGASGFTDIRTRSGASGFHGSVFEFVRNSAFDARNFFDHATPATPGRLPPFRRNEFGFTNGGAVLVSQQSWRIAVGIGVFRD